MIENHDSDEVAKPDSVSDAKARRSLQAEKMAAVARVVRALAHESRNALQRGQACLSLLRLKVNNQPELLALVDETEQAQERLVELYEQVREFAVPRVPLCQPVALDELVKGVWAELAVDDGHRLGLDVECRDARCQADPQVLGAALRELLINALEAAPSESTVSVVIGDAQIDRGSTLSMVVRDQGVGLQEALPDRLFELFYTTKPGHDGLGLARARQQIESHGGQLTVDEAGRGGAQFRIDLPREQ